MTFYSCMELLPRVLSLLLETDDCFQDDTTAEKLLGWLTTSSRTKEYYLNLVEKSSPVVKFISDCLDCEPGATRTVFALRLLGILCEGAIIHKFDIASSTALIQCCWNEGSPVKKPRTEAVVDASSEAEGDPNHLLRLSLDYARGELSWVDASVRCAWFEAVSIAVPITSLNFILRSVGANDVAWNCLNDSSMFVKSAAEDFLAVAILEQFQTTQQDASLTKQVPVDIVEASEPKIHPDCKKAVNVACPQQKQQFSSEIFQKLLSIITTSESSPETSYENEPDNIKNERISTVNTDLNIQPKSLVGRKSAIEVYLKMLKRDHELGLLAARQNLMVGQLCTYLTCCATNNAAFDVVDLLTELMALTPVSDRLSICEILQDVPKTLLTHRNEVMSASYLASVLWRFETRSAKKDEHFKFVILPIVVMIQGDNENCDNLGSIDEDCRQVFDDICRQNKPTCLKLVSASLNSILEYTKQMHLTNEETDFFGTVLVKILQCIQGCNAANPLTHSLIGSTKLSKKCFDILAIICKSHKFGNDFRWATELFTGAVSAVRNPDTNITLLTKVLEVLSEPALLSIKGDNDGVDDLAFVIQKLLMSETGWERRDSAIGFIDRVVCNGNDCGARWVCKHNFPRFLWERLADPESYVRASAAHSLSGLMLNDKITQVFLNDCNLSKEDVVMELCRIVATDNEGFARRAAMATLTTLLKHEGALQEMLLKFNPESCKQFNTTCQVMQKPVTIVIAEFQKRAFEENDISVTDISNDDGVIDCGRSLEEHNMSTATHLGDTQQLGKCDNNTQNTWNFAMRTVNAALSDLDWEVKLRALDYWDTLIKIVLREFLSAEEKAETVITKKGQEFDASQCGQLRRQVDENDIHDVDYAHVNHPRLVCLFSALACLHKIGLQTLMASVADYDRLVGLSCCRLLIGLRQVLRSNGFTLSQAELIINGESDTETIGCSYCRMLAVELGLSCQDLANCKLNKNVMECVTELISIDLDKILFEKSLLINDYTHNPLLLLEDIVAAARGGDETEQLIDCY